MKTPNLNNKYITDLESRVEVLEKRLENYDFFLLTAVEMYPEESNKDFTYMELIGNGEERISFFIDQQTADYFNSSGFFKLVDILQQELSLHIVIEHGKLNKLCEIFGNLTTGKNDSLRNRAMGKMNGIQEVKVHGR